MSSIQIPSNPIPLLRRRPASVGGLRWLALVLIGLALGSGVAGAQARPVAATWPMARLLPDSELVYGPAYYDWDLDAFVAEQAGYLSRYNEIVDGQVLSGSQILRRVAEDYSIGPRVLLALIEMHSGWVSRSEPSETTFPAGGVLPGLQPGLAAAADGLSGVYYAHRFDGLRDIEGVGRLPEVNAATFALLAWLQRDAEEGQWAGLEASSRFHAAWTMLFGDPLLFATDAVVPPAIPPARPQLPFGPGEIWYYVAGPHSPWGSSGPRAAVDFAPPPAQATGCLDSIAWVRAVAAGTVLRSRDGGLVVDLGEDGFEGSGWAHVYAHLSPVGRAEVGTRVEAGDPLGHPSCAGGLESQSRVTFARKLDGEWMPADHPEHPLRLGAWTALPGNLPGEGWLVAQGLPERQASPEKVDELNGLAADLVLP